MGRKSKGLLIYCYFLRCFFCSLSSATYFVEYQFPAMISQSYPRGIKRPRPFSSQEIMRVASKKMQDGSEPIYTGNPHLSLLTPPFDLISVPHTYPISLLPPSYTPHSFILIICVPCPSHTSLSPFLHPPTYILPLSYSSYPPPLCLPPSLPLSSHFSLPPSLLPCSSPLPSYLTPPSFPPPFLSFL